MAQCGELSITPLAMICGLWNVALTSLSHTTKKMKKSEKLLEYLLTNEVFRAIIKVQKRKGTESNDYYNQL
jgi:hypothetical protein